MPIEFKPTSRGFMRGRFLDNSGSTCSIQKSSLADEDCLWLGADEITHASGAEPFNTRMHLNQKMAAELIPLLKRFVKTGQLKP